MRENAAVDLLLTFALDLLAQVERQQRALSLARTELVGFAAEAGDRCDHTLRREHCINTMTSTVAELSQVIAEQSTLLAEMREAVQTLRARS
jgi:hypothetical protein